MSRYLPDKNYRPESVESTLEKLNSRWNPTGMKILSFERVSREKLLLSVTRNSANSLVEKGRKTLLRLLRVSENFFDERCNPKNGFSIFVLEKRLTGVDNTQSMLTYRSSRPSKTKLALSGSNSIACLQKTPFEKAATEHVNFPSKSKAFLRPEIPKRCLLLPGRAYA